MWKFCARHRKFCFLLIGILSLFVVAISYSKYKNNRAVVNSETADHHEKNDAYKKIERISEDVRYIDRKISDISDSVELIEKKIDASMYKNDIAPILIEIVKLNNAIYNGTNFEHLVKNILVLSRDNHSVFPIIKRIDDRAVYKVMNNHEIYDIFVKRIKPELLHEKSQKNTSFFRRLIQKYFTIHQKKYTNDIADIDYLIMQVEFMIKAEEYAKILEFTNNSIPLSYYNIMKDFIKEVEKISLIKSDVNDIIFIFENSK